MRVLLSFRATAVLKPRFVDADNFASYTTEPYETDGSSCADIAIKRHTRTIGHAHVYCLTAWLKSDAYSAIAKPGTVGLGGGEGFTL